jgi:hypothetical protein
MSFLQASNFALRNAVDDDCYFALWQRRIAMRHIPGVDQRNDEGGIE